MSIGEEGNIKKYTGEGKRWGGEMWRGYCSEKFALVAIQSVTLQGILSLNNRR